MLETAVDKTSRVILSCLDLHMTVNLYKPLKNQFVPDQLSSFCFFYVIDL